MKIIVPIKIYATIRDNRDLIDDNSAQIATKRNW